VSCPFPLLFLREFRYTSFLFLSFSFFFFFFSSPFLPSHHHLVSVVNEGEPLKTNTSLFPFFPFLPFFLLSLSLSLFLYKLPIHRYCTSLLISKIVRFRGTIDRPCVTGNSLELFLRLSPVTDFRKISTTEVHALFHVILNHHFFLFRIKHS